MSLECGSLRRDNSPLSPSCWLNFASKHKVTSLFVDFVLASDVSRFGGSVKLLRGEQPRRGRGI